MFLLRLLKGGPGSGRYPLGSGVKKGAMSIKDFSRNSLEGSNYIRSVCEFMVNNKQAISNELGQDMDDYIQELENELENYLSDTEISIRTSQSSLTKILESGRLKNCFELKNNPRPHINNYLDLRKRSETRNGSDIDATPEERPLYGYLKKDKMVAIGVDCYGDVEIILDDSMKDRSTFTMGDSLDKSKTVRSSGLNKPSLMSTDFFSEVDFENISTKDVADTLRYVRESIGNPLRQFGSRYFEAQIFGGIEVSNIKKIRLPQGSKLDLSGYDIEVEYFEEEY